ncbi:hypothetical protein PAXRUDRAFT_153286 [Paxillus rubicundulus Ve08.2h10]|uniref:Uncharacterized protein n=1 Tax=Paxillus rubicundulus Ve08.2h10 TaxID=930991 RepID=A0A0D0DSU7_9AGAM|nr:hypothetical protein PAXRUDRAFT_153286 [Paxillus rubicundulus Ve08.2h10]
MKEPQRTVYADIMLAGDQRIASAGEDESISIWDREERRTVGEPWQGCGSG